MKRPPLSVIVSSFPTEIDAPSAVILVNEGCGLVPTRSLLTGAIEKWTPEARPDTTYSWGEILLAMQADGFASQPDGMFLRQ